MVPLVTLAVPVFNAEEYIAVALESLLAQDYDNIEIIITDNASEDRTQEICLGYARDSRVQYVRNLTNLGAGPNFNLGLKSSKGEFFKWCAHDDLISPNYVSECVRALEADSQACLAFGATKCVGSLGEPIPTVGEEMGAIISDDPARRLRECLQKQGACFPIFGVFRRAALERTKLLRPYYGSDRGLLSEVAMLGKMIRVPDATMFIREHSRRSVNIQSKVARARWHNGSGSWWSSAEHINLLCHLVGAARAHPELIPAALALKEVGIFASRPRQMGRYLLEAASLVSFRRAYQLKNLLTKVASRSPAVLVSRDKEERFR